MEDVMIDSVRWAPLGAVPILQGSSQWMVEMAWVVEINGARVVIRATIEPEILAKTEVVRMFLGRAVSDSPSYPRVSVYGSYDPSFRQPSWLVVEEKAAGFDPNTLFNPERSIAPCK